MVNQEFELLYSELDSRSVKEAPAKRVRGRGIFVAGSHLEKAVNIVSRGHILPNDKIFKNASLKATRVYRE